MKTYFIRPKEFQDYSQKFEQQYIDYTKKEALRLYRQKFPSFLIGELEIEKKPYINI